jgi:uncharacterized protein (TIGR03000 family)
MYSVVLMVAMTTGGDLPDCHRCGGCFGGGHGCFGGGHGCFGGGHGCFGGLFRGHGCHGCHGCYGGCYGGGCNGGGCFGCNGGGCAGYVVTCGGNGCAGCNGHAAPTQNNNNNNNNNNNGNGSGNDEPALTAAELKEYQEILNGLSGKEKKELQDWWKEATNKEKREYLKGGEEAKGPTPAKLIVKVPANTRLTIEGAPTTSTARERTFVSPKLVPGQAYYYTIEATYVKGGRSVVVKRQVEVRAGKTTQVTLGASRTVEALVRR